LRKKSNNFKGTTRMAITIDKSKLDPWVSDLGQLVALLRQDPDQEDQFDFIGDWFEDPFQGNRGDVAGNIPGYSMRPGQLMSFLADVLDPASKDPPKLSAPEKPTAPETPTTPDAIGLNWYRIRMKD